LVLVLDNCEHVLAGAAALVARLLGACPGLRVLATSREVLRLSGEHVLVVPPLALPAPEGPEGPETPERLAAVAAVRLFADRAAAADAAFALTAENAPAVAAVCRRLDGLPLAIELAAARTRLLPPRALLARLGRRLPLLGGGPRDAPARQQTLRATLEWSHALLTPAEQALFRRLAVFAGGCTPDAAEAVCAGAAGAVPVAVLDGVASLLDKSLVQREEGPGGEARVGMLETLREFAAERLEASGEAGALACRHAAYYAGLAERAAPALHGPAQREWFDRLERERDNLRAALRWSAETAEAAAGAPEAGPATAGLGLRLGQALFWFWLIRGPRHEGLPWLRRLLALPETAVPAAARAWTCHYAAVLSALVSGFDAAVARPLYEEALARARATGQPALVAEAQNGLGHTAWAAGDYARARRHLEAALRAAAAARAAPAPVAGPPGPHRLVPMGLLWALVRVAVAQGDLPAARARAAEGLAYARATGDPLHLAFGLSEMGDVAAASGDLAAARRWGEESLRHARAVGGPGSTANALRLLGQVEAAAGDPRRARARYAESLGLYRELGEQHFVAEVLALSGDAALALGDAADARARYGEAHALGRACGLRPAIAPALEGLAALAGAAGRCEQALRLAGAAAALREAMGAPLPPPARTRLETRLAPARRALSAAGQAAAHAAGRALPLEQAVAGALAGEGSDAAGTGAPPAPAPGHPPPAPRAARPAGLTAREVEVLRLVAAGQTDRAIAVALVLSEKTVGHHLASIFRKLDVATRAGAAAFAVRHGLA
jgi:predicted ATPase/DNA-binding CsgD family transcriptional regulator